MKKKSSVARAGYSIAIFTMLSYIGIKNVAKNALYYTSNSPFFLAVGGDYYI